MSQWFKKSLKSRTASNLLLNLAKKNDSLRTLLAKDKNGEYIVYINGVKEEVDKIYHSFTPPESYDDYEEDINDDLTYLFEQIKFSKKEDKIIAINIFFLEIKRLVEDRRKIIKVFTDDRIHNIRKIGQLTGDKNNPASFQFQNCGDPRGMIIWNNTYLRDIKKVSV